MIWRITRKFRGVRLGSTLERLFSYSSILQWGQRHFRTMFGKQCFLERLSEMWSVYGYCYPSGDSAIIPAVIIGGIENFGCRKEVIFFFGIDRSCYYMDNDGDCGEDSDGEFHSGRGTFDLRSFGSMTVVDPDHGNAQREAWWYSS